MNKNFYKSVLNNLPVGYVCLKVFFDEQNRPYDFVFADVNSLFMQFFRTDEKELLNKSIFDDLPDFLDFKDEWLFYIQMHIEGKLNSEEKIYSNSLDKGFTIKLFSPDEDSIVTILSPDDGSFVSYFDRNKYNSEDIKEENFKGIYSEKSAWEKRLHEIADVLRLENDEQFQRIIENLPFAISIKAKDGTILYANPKAQEIFEMGEAVIGEKLARDIWVDKDSRELWEAEIQRNGIAKDFEMQIVTFSGRKLWAVGSGIVIQYKGEDCVLCAQYDITQRKVIEAALTKSEKKYRILFENAVEAIFVVQEQKLQIFNSMFQTLSGYTKEEITLMHVTDFVHPDDQEKALINYLERENSGNVKNPQTIKFMKKGGETIWVSVKGIQIEWNGKPSVLYFAIDITESKNATDALSLSEEKYRLLTEFASDVIWVYNISRRRFTYVSPSVYALRGFTAEEALQETLEDSLTPESLEFINETLRTVVPKFVKDPENPKYFINEIRQYCKNGDAIWIEMSTKLRINKEGEIEAVGVSRNIEERKKAEREVLYLSYHDEVTQLYNRRFYEEELKRINIKSNLPITLVMADVNGLKLTNDAFGHLAGDNLLKKFSQIVKEKLRATDVAARIGGDEFAFLLPKTNYSQARKIINSIKEEILKVKDLDTILSVSFGWACKHSVEAGFETLYMQAEDNMYREKLIESSKMKNDTIELVLERVFHRDEEEKRHSQAVAELCRKTGEAMGLNQEEILSLELLGKLHDIGKIVVHEDILLKKEKLTEGDWLEIKRHPEVGYQILRSADDYVHIAEYVLSHHERVDGSGYPRSIKGEEIEIPSKILAICEAYDSMVNPRKGKKNVKKEHVVDELIKHSGSQFDLDIVNIFIKNVLGENINA